MAISSSSSSSSFDNEVQKCSKQCLESFKTLQKNFDSETENHSRARLEIQGYELALESLESRIIGHEKNELAWGEKYEFQNYELNQMSANDKNGLGYGTLLNEINNMSETDSEISMSVIEVRSSDEEFTSANDRFSKADGYHAVPPPIIGNFLTPRAEISFAGKTNEVNIKKPKSVYESVVPKPKINRDKVIIEDWNSDNEDDVSAVKTVSPVKTNETQIVRNRVDKIGVLTRTGLVNPVRPNGKRAVHTISTARPISTVRPVSTTRPFAPKIAQTSSDIRPIYLRMDNVRPRASYSPIKRSYYTRPAVRPKNLKQDVKISRVKNITTVGTRAIVNTNKGKGNPENFLQDHAVVDSGCSSHMTGNKAYLLDYKYYNGDFVAFGSDPKGGKITGKGKIKTANLDFDDVYFVDELTFNLFSVSQMCDKKNSVLFTDTECLIMSPSFKLLDESQVVLRAPRQIAVYSLDLKNIVPSRGITYIYANAIKDESKLWHMRLGHVNFKNINKLVKGHLVRGLPSKVFVNDHTCVACKKGKQHKASCKAKLERTIRKPLELLHMDLFGPVLVESINKKKYYLVVTDDFSRFSWVFFLATKDETNEILYKFITGLENQLNHKVKIIRSDHGTEFKNHAMNEFCAKKGIKREFSVARTPQQNSKPPSISFMRPFGCPLTILNTLDPLGKFDGKSDEGYLLGYSTSSKAFRVYNKRTKRVEENMHIDFLEDQPNVAGSGTQEHYVAGLSEKDKVPTQEYILLPLHPHRPRISVEDVVQAAQEKPSEFFLKDNDVQDSEDVAEKEEQHTLTEAEQALKDDLERMIAQEIVAKALDDATRQAFEEEKKRAAQATSINKLNTGRPSVSTFNSP
ncbi:putative ribonuclease H-like domain-containing protein [Tanacetum coccineum]